MSGQVKRFVQEAINRLPSDAEIVASRERIARTLGIKPYELDWRIWEFQRGK